MAFPRNLPLLDSHKINMETNFENPHSKKLDLGVKMLCFTPKKICSSAKQILQRPISKYPTNQNIFHLCLHVWLKLNDLSGFMIDCSFVSCSRNSVKFPLIFKNEMSNLSHGLPGGGTFIVK